MPKFPTGHGRAVVRNGSRQVAGGKRPQTSTNRFPGDWWLRVPGRPGSLPSLGQREEKYDLLATPVSVHGTMAAVTANRSLRIALVARRHIDLKRVCSCCCLP
ncbi:Ms4527A family Cys-rich leader peptide [Mycobacterium sp. 852002-50816_SCH5313054-b]|uniref:Ms4527A family Cys-rich leader peptide n=1 Tax=Mycobacterium sp. 852002-50816_SCH5313054-b TaxID=1834092 RepID=UPI003512D330